MALGITPLQHAILNWTPTVPYWLLTGDRLFWWGSVASLRLHTASCYLMYYNATLVQSFASRCLLLLIVGSAVFLNWPDYHKPVVLDEKITWVLHWAPNLLRLLPSGNYSLHASILPYALLARSMKTYLSFSSRRLYLPALSVYYWRHTCGSSTENKISGWCNLCYLGDAIFEQWDFHNLVHRSNYN